MPGRLTFGPLDSMRVRFASSPLWETVAAVRVLQDPERHRFHQPWLRATAPAVAGLDLAPLRALLPLRGYTPDFLAPPPAGPHNKVADELCVVGATDLDRVASELLRCAEQWDPNPPNALGELLADPAAAVTTLQDLLRRCHDRLVQPYWPQLDHLLASEIAFRSRQAAERGLEHLLARLHPDVSWSDGVLDVRQRSLSDRDLQGQGLVLMPSVFTWPTPVVYLDEPWLATLVYPVAGIAALWARPVPVPRALARLLGPTRAAVLSGLGEAMDTSAVAATLHISASTANEHLTVLRDAGLVHSAREGRVVRYRRSASGDALLAVRPPG